MNFLISGEMNMTKGDDARLLDFIRVQNETKPEPKKRVVPKEPEPKKEPPKPKIELSTKTNIVKQNIDIPTPNLNMNLDLVNDGLSGAEVSQSLGNLNDSIAINLMPIFKIPPKCPNRATMLKKNGQVKLEFIITETGSVQDIKIIESNPPKMFDNSSISALRKWKFKPKVVGGKAVSQRAQQIIDYKCGN